MTLLQATTLTFPVVVAEVGQSLHLLTAAATAALVGAALLSALIFPALALAIRPWSPPGGQAPDGQARTTAIPRTRCQESKLRTRTEAGVPRKVWTLPCLPPSAAGKPHCRRHR